MKFKEWLKINFPKYTDEQLSYLGASWEGCKQEVLKIIFLNTKQNGKKYLDIEKTIKDIEDL